MNLRPILKTTAYSMPAVSGKTAKSSFIAMRYICVCLSAILLSSPSFGLKKQKALGEFDYLYKGLPFEMAYVTRPVIPSRTVSIVDFGGIGDGVASNTKAFADAIASLSEKGGGHLIVPAGIWFTGPIALKSNIDLHITPNAIILFDPDVNLYPIIKTVFEGLDTRRCESPISGEGLENISITGGGTIDGSGDAWRAVKKSKLTSSEWKKKIASGGVLNEKKNCWYPNEGFLKGEQMSDMNVPKNDLTDEQWNEIKSFLRPVMISLRNCENVLLEDVTFQNSPSWNIHPLMCKKIIIKNITVRNPWYAQNGDGIDIDSCEDVLLVDSSFDVGDDGICIKSGKDEDGRKRAKPCRNLIVDNCFVYHGHGGFVVGSEMSGGVENIKVSNCRFLGTDVGLRFKSKRGRGGVVRNIYISDIYMTNIVTETLLFDLFYGGKSAVEAMEDGDDPKPVEIFEVDETTPSFRDIYISNVVCNGAARAMYFNGLPEMPVSNINISNCTISSVTGIEISYSEKVNLDKINIQPQKGEAVVVSNSKEVFIDGKAADTK